MKLNKIVKTNEFFLFVIIVALCLVFGAINPAFFSLTNIFDISRSLVETGIFAMGSLVVMISGGIDLSFMAIALFAMHSIARFGGTYFPDAPFWALLLIGVVIGALLGMMNAVFVGKFKLPAMIVTLGTSNIIKGFCQSFIGARQLNNIPSSMIAFSRFNILSLETADGGRANLHFGVLILLAVILVTTFILKKTTLGRSIYCVGGSESSAERVGFNPFLVLLFVYAFAGAISGMGGVIHASYQRMSNPFDLVGRELNVIAAVVLGGPRVGGGFGNTVGTLLGVLLLTLVQNSLVMLKVPTFWQDAVVGIIIIVGTATQIYRYKKRKKA